MDSQRHQQIKEVFLAAVDQPRDRWESVLVEKCAGDENLKREVRILLDHHVGVDGYAPEETRINLLPSETADEMAATTPELRGSQEAVREKESSGQKPPSNDPLQSPRQSRPSLATLMVSPGVGSKPRTKRSSTTSLHIEQGRFVPGTVIAQRYRIIALIGKGGMGEVYRADDLKLGETVALKFLPPALAHNPKRLEQFMNEVRIARGVSHHNVCRVYDIGEYRDDQFISMEYVDGETLDSLVSRIGRLPEKKAIQLAQELCAALAAIHEAGVLHRDLKPANIMIDGRGHLRLTDFGLASARELHGFEAAAGTPGFVAPESLAGREATTASDIYTMGLLLYELFTGVPAYKPGPAHQVLKDQETSDPVPPTNQAPDLSPEVEQAIMACLAREPGERPKSVRDVSAMLPGGDPLAAAIAAGVTPSPELVAASGGYGRMSMVSVGAWMAVFVVLLAAGRWAQSETGLLSYALLPKPPEVLADRAEQIIDHLGYATPAVDRAYELDLYGEYIGELERKEHGVDRWERLRRSRPAPIDFWYRRSPVPLATMNPLGWISWQDPPHETPGMISLRLTPKGDLRELVVVDERLYWAVHPEEASMATVRPNEKPVEPDWRLLFLAAGLDIERFQRADPIRTPLVFADCRAAWVGAYPENADEPIRVEAAGLRGKPVAFRIIEVAWPLSQNIGAVELGSEHPNTQLLYEVLFGAVVTVTGVAWLVLAARNLRYKRADRAGALRVGYAVFGVLLISMLLSADSMTAFTSWYSPVSNALAISTALGVAFGISYIAIEPYIRRIWPETIVAWTRLLSGQVLDPLIGQSLVVGSALGVLGVCLLAARHWAALWLGHPPPEPMFDYDYGMEPLGSTRQAIGMVLQIVALALAFSVVFALILSLLRVGLRRTWAALVVGAVLCGGFWALKFHASPRSSPETYVLFTIGAAACGVVLVRYGILALATGAYVYYLLKIFPATIEGSWFFDLSLVPIALAMVIVLAGASLALWGTTRRRVFGLAPAPSRATV